MTVIETPVSHATAAQELVEKIRSLQALVPGFELLTLPLDRFQRPRGHQSLPDSFFTPLELALRRAPRFAESVAITPQLIRDMLDHGAAFLPAAVEAERFARGIRRAVSMKRGNVGKLAFDAYRLAQAMNLALDVGLVVPEVEDIKASFPSRRRAAVPAETPAAAAKGKP
jgi:hypothetical protein